jgi:predicted dehydrogenase
MANRVSVALVGAGYWGKRLLPKFLAASGCRIQMVCDLHASHRADVKESYPSLSTTDCYDDLLRESDIDVVVLATPPATHFTLAKKAIEAGKHVWIEKPMALRLDEGNQLVQLAQAKGIILFVDHTFLYDPVIRTIGDLIKKGELGRIYHVFLQRLNLGRIKRDSNVWWNSAPHDISMLLYLLTAQPISISLHGYRYLQPAIEDLNIAVVEMSDGTAAFIYHNWLYPENTAKLTVVGSKKFLVYEGKFDKRKATVYEYTVDQSHRDEPSDQRFSTTIPSKLVAEYRLEGIYAEEPLTVAVSDFLESIRKGRAPLSDGNFSLKVLAVLEAGEESLRSGGRKISLRSPCP